MSINFVSLLSDSIVYKGKTIHPTQKAYVKAKVIETTPEGFEVLATTGTINLPPEVSGTFYIVDQIIAVLVYNYRQDCVTIKDETAEDLELVLIAG